MKQMSVDMKCLIHLVWRAKIQGSPLHESAMCVRVGQATSVLCSSKMSSTHQSHPRGCPVGIFPSWLIDSRHEPFSQFYARLRRKLRIFAIQFFSTRRLPARERCRVKCTTYCCLLHPAKSLTCTSIVSSENLSLNH